MKVSFLEEGEWLDALLQCPGSTFFHTPYWYKVWESYKQYDPVCYVFDFPDGQRVVFPLAVFKLMKGLLRGAISGPGGVYGGPLSPMVISDEKLQRIVAYLKRRYALLDVQCSPFQEFGGGAMHQSGTTQVLCLTHSEKAAEYSKNHRRSIKKATLEGIEAKLYRDEKSWWLYYEKIYVDTLKRWGNRASSIYCWPFFALLFQLPENYRALWLVSNKKAIIAGCILFFFKDHAVFWHGASLDKFWYLRPNHLLHHTIIERIKSNYPYYDFNPSGGHEGVTRFKKGFGARTLNIHELHFESILLKLRRKI